jgi:hypothetical protein
MREVWRVLRGAVLLSALVTPPAELPRKPPAGIKIISDVALPPALNKASDVRWASDDSVYLALGSDGVVELNLKPLGNPRQIFPSAAKLGPRYVTLVAASPLWVAASSILTLNWKSVGAPTYKEEAFEFAKAIDIWKDQILIVGERRDERGEIGGDGAIAWRGSLRNGLDGLKPVLYDVTGPHVRSVDSCATLEISAARFLADGSFILAPGVQPGIQLYDPSGKLVRTWDTGQLGIDTDCASLSPQQVIRLSANYPQSLAWINQRRTIDTLLPLRRGAALVVRSVIQGRAQWAVKRLSDDGSVQTLPLPIPAGNDLLHLSGDSRDGKILLMLYERRPHDLNYATPRLIQIQLPE